MNNKKNFSRIRHMIYLVFKSSPLYCIIYVLLTIASGIVPILQIGVTSDFINLSIGSVNKGFIINQIYTQIFLLMFLLGFMWLTGSINKILRIKMGLSIQKNTSSKILEKCAKLEYQYIESSKSWDLISRVKNNPEEKILNGFINVLSIIETIIRLTGIVFYIISEVWWAALLILLFCVPLFYISIKSGKASYEAHREVSKIERKCNYLSDILIGRDSVDERTIFKYSDSINDSYTELYNKFYKIRVGISFKWLIKSKIGGVFSALSGLIVILVLLKPVVSGQISVGMFISLVNTIFALSNQLSWQLSTQIDTLISSREFIRDFDEFLNLNEVPGVLNKPSTNQEIKHVEFQDVSFKYPNTDNFVLKNISFRLEQHKHYSFVGSNGAGKTTITKLLTGLYNNYTGNIFINGKNLKEYTESEIKGMFSIVYQDFARYSISIRENCLIGNINEINTTTSNETVLESLGIVGLDDAINSMPNGIDTLLGKIHRDGVDLSGGQWQRLALARAIVNKAAVRILDEPTASLDPVKETEIYELFDKINKNVLTIFISHRLGATRIADHIFVLENGRIIEQGTYKELMDHGGIYFNMFEQQRSWYL
ncbi:MAG: ABC transporter ATP-binding protein/permease [Clostridia bacterium]|nr:ABC transporter ATP-binding protein/permease [Clostridia bacterium]